MVMKLRYPMGLEAPQYFESPSREIILNPTVVARNAPLTCLLNNLWITESPFTTLPAGRSNGCIRVILGVTSTGYRLRQNLRVVFIWCGLRREAEIRPAR